MSDSRVNAPNMDSEAEAKAVKDKVELVMSMCGRDYGTKLTVLSYALVFMTIEAEVTFASMLKNLAEMYDLQREGEDE
jgi:hypothetical protein